MRFRFWLGAIAGIGLICTGISANAKDVRNPKLKSTSVLVVDQSDSSILYARNSDVAHPIASITKLMTALVVLDAKQPLDEPIQISEDDKDWPKGSFSRLTVGTQLCGHRTREFCVESRGGRRRARCAGGALWAQEDRVVGLVPRAPPPQRDARICRAKASPMTFACCIYVGGSLGWTTDCQGIIILQRLARLTDRRILATVFP